MQPKCQPGTGLRWSLLPNYYICPPTHIKYQLPNGPIHPTSHDSPTGCPSPLSSFYPSHMTDHQPLSSHTWTPTYRLHLQQVAHLCNLMLHKFHTNIT